MLLFSGGFAGSAFAQTQVEMNAHAAASAITADRRLNTAYAKVRATPELRLAQRAWLGFRDSQCRYEASVYRA